MFMFWVPFTMWLRWAAEEGVVGVAFEPTRLSRLYCPGTGSGERGPRRSLGPPTVPVAPAPARAIWPGTSLQPWL
jgi:hypothetical protein